MKSSAQSKELNMLSGPIWNKVLILALPLAFTGILQQLFNAADIAIVGSFVDDQAVAKAAMAAVGSNSSIVNMMVNFFVGLSIGTNVIISQFIGQGKTDNIHKAVSTSVIIGLVGGTVIALGGELLVDGFETIMGVPADVYDMAVLYLRIYLLGMPVIFLYNFETAIFRSIGNTKTPLVVLAFSGMLNVLLNLFFVLVLKMTVSGVATATVISNVVSSLILFVLLCRTNEVIKIRLNHMRLDPVCLKLILKIGVPAGVQSMVFGIANVCIQSAINSLGTVIMAASAAAVNLEFFSFYIMTSFGQACTTIVGQNYGAGQYERCVRTLKITLGFAFLFYLITAFILIVFGPVLLSLFNSDPEVIGNGMERIRYMVFGHVFSTIIEVVSGYLRGFGVSTLPAICSLVGACGLRIVWVYIIFPLNPTFINLIIIFPISLFLTALAVVTVLLFLRKSLKERTMQMKAALA